MPTQLHDDSDGLSTGGRLSFNLSIPSIGAARISDPHHAPVAWNTRDIPWICQQREFARVALHCIQGASHDSDVDQADGPLFVLRRSDWTMRLANVGDETSQAEQEVQIIQFLQAGIFLLEVQYF